MIRFSLELREELGLTAHTGSDDPFFTEISNYVVKAQRKDIQTENWLDAF